MSFETKMKGNWRKSARNQFVWKAAMLKVEIEEKKEMTRKNTKGTLKG